MKMKIKTWNPEMESMPAEQMDKLRTQRLRRMIDRKSVV